MRTLRSTLCYALILVLLAVSVSSANPPGPLISVTYVRVEAVHGAASNPHWDSTITVSDPDGVSSVGDAYGFSAIGDPGIDMGVPGPPCPLTFTTAVIHNENPVRQARAEDCETTPHKAFYLLVTGQLGAISWTVSKADATVVDVKVQNGNLTDKHGLPLVPGDFPGTKAPNNGTKFTGEVKKNGDGPYFLGLCADPPGDMYCQGFELSEASVPSSSSPSLTALWLLLAATGVWAVWRMRGMSQRRN